MSYSKQLLVLKQVSEGFSVNGKTLSGIVRIEVEKGVSTIYISLINFASVKEGEFYVCIIDDNNLVYSFSLGQSPFSTTLVCEKLLKIENSVAIMVFYFNEEVIPIATSFINKKIELSLFKKIAREELEKSTAFKQPVIEPEIYNDELLATENYFLNEDIIPPPFNFEELKEPYYQTVKQDLDELFEKYPKEERLSKAISDSTWVKIYYNEEKYYTVGLVNQQNRPKYICYGVPARYSVTPPKELEGCSSFLPLSLFDLKGDGYWMIYQDAVTGELVKLND